MKEPYTHRLNLRRLILGICLFSVVLALAGSLHASYLIQRDLLLRGTLEVNRVYAAKLASTTEYLLTDIRRQLAFSADILADMEKQPGLMASETRREELQLANFNSTMVVSPKGIVLAASPSSPQLLNIRLTSYAADAALAERIPMISAPYQASNGRWLVLYSYPIFSRDFRFLGFLAGTLYLHEDNVLDRLLGQHAYRDGSFLYVVDRQGMLLYHPDRSQLGQLTPDNAALAAARRGESGELRFTDSKGVEMLAGFASVPSTGWSIVAQRPAQATLKSLSDLLIATFYNTVPLLLLSILSIWFLSGWIARPLWDLAGIAKRMQDPDSPERLRKVKSWYLEAAQLKRGLMIGLASMQHKILDLRRESTTDTLTGLLNRRGLNEAIKRYQADETPVSVVLIDVDRFKGINDRYGHAAGDGVLRTLAQLMSHSSRSGDTLARAGGEEFVMLLPGASTTAAVSVANRLRLAMQAAVTASATPITISLGVAHYPDHGASLDAVLQRADDALYFAKNNGRNAICVVDTDTPLGLRLVERETPEP